MSQCPLNQPYLSPFPRSQFHWRPVGRHNPYNLQLLDRCFCALTPNKQYILAQLYFLLKSTLNSICESDPQCAISVVQLISSTLMDKPWRTTPASAYCSLAFYVCSFPGLWNKIFGWSLHTFFSISLMIFSPFLLLGMDEF